MPKLHVMALLGLEARGRSASFDPGAPICPFTGTAASLRGELLRLSAKLTVMLRRISKGRYNDMITIS